MGKFRLRSSFTSFFFFMLFGCTSIHPLEPLRERLYELDILYIDSDLSEVQSMFSISNDDYSECLLLESLISYNQNILYIFKDPSIYLKEKIYELNHYSYEINQYIIYMNQYDINIIHIINSYLNKT